MKTILGLIALLMFVSCDEVDNFKITPFVNGDIVKGNFTGRKCVVDHLHEKHVNDLHIKCGRDGGLLRANSANFRLEGTAAATVENSTTTTKIPKDLLELRCSLDGKETSLERELHLSLDLKKFKTGEVCTLKKVSLKYE